MPHIPIPRSASQVMKNFRTRQLKGLTNHLQLYGPLPTTSEAAVLLSSANPDVTVQEPSIVFPNPFIPRKNPKSGKWRGPKYSLRRQADLLKQARETGNLAIMPPGCKLFALDLRMRRLQASVSPAESAILSASRTAFGTNPKTVEGRSATSRTEREKEQSETEQQEVTSESQSPFSTFETELQARQDKFAALAQELEQKQTQRELDELAEFEKGESEAELQGRRERGAEYRNLEARLQTARSEVVRAGQRLEKAKEDHLVSVINKAQDRLWTNPFWVGDVKKKTPKGEELGIKLYAGKKKMFKGHAWEKEKAKRHRRQSMLMRDMKARIARYKSYYKKRKPNPLKPSRLSKPPKLPF